MESIHSEYSSSYVVVGSSHPNYHIVLVLLRAWAIWGCQRRVAVMLIGSYSVYLLLFLIKITFSFTAVTSESSQLPSPSSRILWCLHILVHRFKYADLPAICVAVIPRACAVASIIQRKVRLITAMP